ncbi:MAG TPA: hypothetical protein PKA06_08180, partial [Gemmatales bacterium]|nr:hypothetical protein [Gemmatales bacterium]
SVINPNITGHIAAHVLPIVSMQDYRFMLALFAKRSIVIPESTLEEGEFFFISTPRAKLFSQNVPNDCFKPEHEKVRSLPLYVPDVREEILQCGTRYSLVSMKMPIIFESFWSGSFVDGATMVGRAQPRYPAQRREAANPPRAMYSMTIQVARPTEKRDKIVAAIRDDMERELAAVQRESAQVQSDTLNRLILICLATISLCALAITWISRSSLAPLVNVADAVSELTPKDLRLKFEGAELDPNKLPEELAPIVQRLQESLESLEQAFSREKRA